MAILSSGHLDSWRAIQKQVAENAVIYDHAFPFIPRVVIRHPSVQNLSEHILPHGIQIFLMGDGTSR